MQTATAAIGITGVGKYIPPQLITNERIEELSGIKAATIVEKTGIETRYIVAEGQHASEISAHAARQALAMAGIEPRQLGMIICCTFSGDYVYPAMACKVQEILGARNAGSFGLLANCTGFQIGLGLAADRMRYDAGVGYSLVIGSAIQSRFINWHDPDIAMYFGDGAGAAVLAPVPQGYGVLANEVFSNPKAYDSVRLRGGGSSYPLRPENIDQGLQYYEMDGLEVWKQLVQYQPKVIRKALDKIGKSVADVDFFIFHQANLRLIEYLMAKMRQPMHKTFTNVARIGNTADASLAIALCEAVEADRIKRDDLLVISGVGAGFSFGASVVRWY